MTLEELNHAAHEALVPDLLACCDVLAWADAVARGRPYADTGAVLAAADAAARFTRSEVDRALAAHLRIGDRAQGESVQASWSRQEQGAVDRDEATLQALAEGNAAYEARFDRVFLICATGLSGEQILDRLRSRLRNDDAAEAVVVADELRRIALVRLGKLLGTPAQVASLSQGAS